MNEQPPRLYRSVYRRGEVIGYEQGVEAEQERITNALEKEIATQKRTVAAAWDILLTKSHPTAVGDKDYSEGYLAGLEFAKALIKGEQK